jgi:16S rRNA (adenine1518-N6/adenine1519-N6)-dimethyltransferase
MSAMAPSSRGRRADRPLGARAEPSQPTLARMQRFSIRPDRDLGQCFLVDSNVLGVIERCAALSREDVVLEIGGGLGVLSERLAERVGHLHVVELDERLREALCDATDPHANVTLHWADATKLDLAALAPAPTKVVANLPYGVAATLVLRTIAQLEQVGLWVVMVQREVGERLAAMPGGGAYGATSVIAQLTCDVEIVRAIPRTVFRPQPNVDSVLLALRRRRDAAHGRAQGPDAELRALIGAAFAHRRKTLAGSLALSGHIGAQARQQVRAALLALGLPEDARAERLAPEDFRELARTLGG